MRSPCTVNLGRRRFGAVVGGALASLALGGAGCTRAETRYADDGRMHARPRGQTATSAKGVSRLGLGASRDAILQVPHTLSAAPVPLLVLFHGAGGSAEGILRRLGAAADSAGIAVLAPDSRGSTWDAIRGGFGPDVDFVNRALERTFERVAVDPERVAAGGFSDGATYALSLGAINGDLFRRIAAFSPGFIVDGTRHGTPRFFISHGTADPILPIDQCSRAIVPALRRRGYDVAFREFAGGHEMPAEIVRDAMTWVAAPPYRAFGSTSRAWTR